MARPRRQVFRPNLAEFRRRSRLTQEEVAERLGATTESISRHERGVVTPSAFLRRRYCELYDATDAQLGFVEQPSDTSQAPPDSSTEEVSKILERVRTLTRVGSDELVCFELGVDDLVSRYEVSGPVKLAPLLSSQRRQLEAAIDEYRDPRQRRRLFRVAGQVSGLLAYMAVNRGRYSLARAYSLEATHLGRFAEDRDLLAWVKGTESFCEYYAGDYRRSFELAREGLDLAGDGPQRVRLLINGEARALGKLGDAAGVNLAVKRAYDALDQLPEIPGVNPCVSFGGYSRARLASNAVTAYVDLGRPEEVALHAAQARDEFDISESSWSQSLIRLDLANSMVAARTGDPEEASSLITAALDISAGNPIASVVQRSRSFVQSTAKWRGIPAVDDAHELVRTVARLG
ncbi:MAG: helix-turn-helix transcriptional regulator [Pseudonocardia sp.]|jgi:DNA-binding XRE family transcriptional regulator/tetratricopeptide (TPR) repeat protein|uniref:helix-turn-helix domain-containing protein n=1 Tax=Pseudonocardia sp. TaxID=60912 RepID=UPI001AD3055A|nr:helix-turn-helix transcriptional regulator [Pseudonocardia sp.]MBN9099401.1 helix-turn-helix transcriptional regulator [Pseudonocardia sp.]